MVFIPRSQGVQVGKTTETGLAPKSMAQTQILPNAITQLGGTIAGIGLDKLQKEQAEQRKAQEEFQATQALDLRNKLRRFDNEASISLSEMPDSPDVINSYKQRVLEDRKAYFEELSTSYGDDKRLQKVIKQEYETSQVPFEYAIDKELSRKQKNYNTNSFYESISDLEDRFGKANSEVEFAQIGADLNETLKFGLSTGIVNAKDIDRQQDAFRELRKARQTEILRGIAWESAKSGQLLLDPTNKDDKELVDNNYELAILKGADPIKEADSIAINQGILPTQAKRSMSATLLSGNNNQKLNAALRIDYLIDENQSLQGQFSSDQIAFSQAIKNRHEQGLPVDKVIEYAEAEIKQNKSQDRLIRMERFNQDYAKSGTKFIEKVDDIAKKIKGNTGFLGFNRADVPDTLVSEIRSLTQDFYLNEGVDINTAFDSAEKKVLGEWAITNIGQKRFQKHAPEVYYKGGHKWIQNQAINEVKKLTLEPLPNIKNEIRLQLNPPSLASGQPSYYVFREREGYPIEPVLDSRNMPLIFKPDITKVKEYKDAQEELSKLKLSPEKEKKIIEGRMTPATQDEKLSILSGGLY